MGTAHPAGARATWDLVRPDWTVPHGAVPVPLTPLLGRDADVAAVTRLLGTHRLVTLTGVGGAGKTRLAVEVAAAFPASCFADLSGLDDPAEVADAIATALGDDGDPPPTTDNPRPTTGAGRPTGDNRLLVVDNCEHVLPAAAAAVDALGRDRPGVRVLATSREPLRLPAEATWAVPPLALPDPGGRHTLADLASYPATRLFLDRAGERAGRPVPAAYAADVIAVCTALDGLPLAIQLAAGWTNRLTVPELAARLTGRLDPLRNTDPTAAPRHRTLDAVIDWSYRALDEPEQHLLRQLAVFAGPFDADAAAGLQPDPDTPRAPVRTDPDTPPTSHRPDPDTPRAPVRTDPGALLASLVDKSLLVRAGNRYRMLETIRRFALAVADPAETDDARERHAAVYLRLAETAEPLLLGSAQATWLARLGEAHDNLRVAMAWLQTRPGDRDLRMATALAAYCHLRGHYRQGRQWLTDALDRRPDAPPAALSRALIEAAWLASHQGDHEDAARLAARCQTYRPTGADLLGVARLRTLLGAIARERGQYEVSTAHLAAALDMFASAGDPWHEARAMRLLGFTAYLSGDPAGAEPYLRRALDRFRAYGHADGTATCLTHLGAVAHYRGRAEEARTALADALRRHTALRFRRGVDAEPAGPGRAARRPPARGGPAAAEQPGQASRGRRPLAYGQRAGSPGAHRGRPGPRGPADRRRGPHPRRDRHPGPRLRTPGPRPPPGHPDRVPRRRRPRRGHRRRPRHRPRHPPATTHPDPALPPHRQPPKNPLTCTCGVRVTSRWRAGQRWRERPGRRRVPRPRRTRPGGSATPRRAGHRAPRPGRRRGPGR